MLTRGLVIDEPWIGLILSRKKTWEMRSTNTKIRGPIGLIRKGSGQVVGIADIVDCRPSLTQNDYADHEARHQIPPDRQLGAVAGGWIFPWVFSEARPLRQPVPYRHPPGAVVWVTLDSKVIAEIINADLRPDA